MKTLLKLHIYLMENSEIFADTSFKNKMKLTRGGNNHLGKNRFNIIFL